MVVSASGSSLEPPPEEPVQALTARGRVRAAEAARSRRRVVDFMVLSW
jgi:hypothetical protein